MRSRLKNGRFTKRGDLAALHALSDDLTVLYDSQDIEYVRSYAEVPESATAVAVHSEDGDYVEVWFSEDSAPFLDASIYERTL